MTKAKALTEEQWLTCDEVLRLMLHLRQHCRISRVPGGRRRLRLVACAFCRRAWHLMGQRQRELLEVVERAADGRAGRQELAGVTAELQPFLPTDRPTDGVTELLAGAIYSAASPSPLHAAEYSRGVVTRALFLAEEQGRPGNPEAPRYDRWMGAELLRDIFWVPHRPRPTLDPACLAWEGGRVTQLARAIYDERRWQDLPILADALEEAGCGDADLLGHFRSGKEHARGCWAVDLILGIP
jgi:hypothetical protein